MRKTPEEQAEELIKKHLGLGHEQSVRIAISIADELIYELSDLPQIPYNIRREKFWVEVQTILKNKKLG